MNRQQFIDTLFARAKEAGFEACEVYYSASDNFSTSVFKGEITEYSVSESLGLGFRGLYEGRMGYASTQILDEDALSQRKWMLRRRMENGVAVCNVKGYSTECVSQLTISMALSLTNHLRVFDDYVKSGEYSKSGIQNKLTPTFNEVYGKTFNSEGGILKGNVAPETTYILIKK